LLEKIRSVCKLISVEGDFAEIYSYENRKTHFGKLFSSKKKALIVINAKAHIGYDFKKLDISADTATKTVYVRHFPQPEILSIEPELEFYDIRNDIFNVFTPQDMTALNKGQILYRIAEMLESRKDQFVKEMMAMGIDPIPNRIIAKAMRATSLGPNRRRMLSRGTPQEF
jgi:hypothetical protein